MTTNKETKKQYNFSEFITLLSNYGFTGKLPCDIKVAYRKPDNSLHGTNSIMANLKFLEDCVYELGDFNHMWFKPGENITFCIKDEYNPAFSIIKDF